MVAANARDQESVALQAITLRFALTPVASHNSNQFSTAREGFSFAICFTLV